jgi:hypothetical protein
MEKSLRETVVEAIILYSCNTDEIPPQKLIRMAKASKAELIDMLIEKMNLRALASWT